MGATSILRSLSRLRPTAKRSASSVVTPLPEQTRFSKEVTAKLDALRSSEYEYASASWLVDVLDEENIELLDACNGLVEKIDAVHKYVDSLQTATRLLAIQGRSSQEMFKECSKVEARCATLDRCSPRLCRLMGRKEKQASHGEQDEKLHEALSGSREVASMGCHLLQRALSFKTRQGFLKTKSKLSTTWSSSLNELKVIINKGQKKCGPWRMNELETMVKNAQIVQDQVKSPRTSSVDVDNLRRSCMALEEGVVPLEERVREVYKLLISIRMVLLGLLSTS